VHLVCFEHGSAYFAKRGTVFSCGQCNSTFDESDIESLTEKIKRYGKDNPWVSWELKKKGMMVVDLSDV
jgi:hypothetical protein